MNKNQNSSPSSSNQNQMSLQGAPQSNFTESLKNQPFELETKPHPTELLIKKAQNYKETSEMNLLKDAWKHKETLWQYVPSYKLIALGLSSVAALAGLAIKSKTLRLAIVKRNMVQAKNMNLYGTTKLTFIPRPAIYKEWDKIVNDETSSQPMVLIEGYQGTGKSFLVRRYIEVQSQVRPTVYISLREIHLETWKQVISRQIKFYPEVFFLSAKDQYEYAPFCLLDSFHELKKLRWWFAPLASFYKKRRPIFVLDDVQRLFKKKEYEELQTFIINTMLIPIRDENEAVIFLVTSDYSIEQELSNLSGMSTRLKTFPFPKIDGKEFEDVMKKDLENLKKINKRLTQKCLLQFYEDFHSDLRSLNEFIRIYDGNYEETKSKLIEQESNKVRKYLKDPFTWKYEFQILSFLIKHKEQNLEDELIREPNVEVIKRKMNALKNLIDQNIVRQTSTTLNQGKIYEFHSPKYSLAVKKLLENETTISEK